jgi:hypothetical protein
MADSIATAESLLSQLRTAARELLPVNVEVGADQARFSSFLSALHGDVDAAQPYVLLEPIAADALPQNPSPACVTAADGDSDWAVTGGMISRDGPRRARLQLKHARVHARERAEVVFEVQTTDLLVLVVPGGLHGSSNYVFPIQRIDAHGCEIRASDPLAVGQAFERVEIIGDRRLLRRASAHVISTVPWYLPDGSRSFRCELNLSDEVPLDPASSHDLVTDPREVRRLVDLAGMMSVQGWYEAPGLGRGELRFVAVDKDSLLVALADVPSAQAGDVVTKQIAPACRIGFDLFAIAYELDVRPLACEAGRLRTSLPLIARRRRRHRREHRVAVGEAAAVEVTFRHPVTGLIQNHQLSELSFSSLAFTTLADRVLLWNGLPLEDATLSWANERIALGDLLVERIEARDADAVRCVAAIQRADVASDPKLILLIASLAHPLVRVHDGSNFSALHQTYVKAGLFGPHMHRNLAPILAQTEAVWSRLHGQAADLVRTFVHGTDAAPDAAVTVMRAFEHGWVSQHFVDTSTEINGSTGMLQAAYLDHLVPRPDGRYLLFFIKVDNHVMNAYLKRFFASTGTPDAVSRSGVELWLRRSDGRSGPQVPSAVELHQCRVRDRRLIYRAAQRCFGNAAANALSLSPAELDLPDTRARFADADLQRHRRCEVVWRDDLPLYAIVEEYSTPGMNLTWMLNAAWIIPLHPESDRDGEGLHRALASLVDRPAQSVTGERFLNLPPGLDPDVLAAWGFEREAALFLYVLTRAGVHRFFHYTAARYGEVEAMTSRRERRRESNAKP